MEQRQKHIEKAKQANFLDAVFFIVYYNTHIKVRQAPDIEPQEVFKQYDENQYQTALAKAKKLFSQSTKMGESYYQMSGAKPYQEAYTRLKTENPGFSEECYDLTVKKGIWELR